MVRTGGFSPTQLCRWAVNWPCLEFSPARRALWAPHRLNPGLVLVGGPVGNAGSQSTLKGVRGNTVGTDYLGSNPVSAHYSNFFREITWPPRVCLLSAKLRLKNQIINGTGKISWYNAKSTEPWHSWVLGNLFPLPLFLPPSLHTYLWPYPGCLLLPGWEASEIASSVVWGLHASMSSFGSVSIFAVSPGRNSKWRSENW